MKHTLVILFSIFISFNGFGQSEMIKTNLSKTIKSTLLAPSTFKLHRFDSKQISPSVQKLLSDLQKLKIVVKNKVDIVSLHTDSLQVKIWVLKKLCDSLDHLVVATPNYLARKSIELKIKELDVVTPKDQEFLFWMGRNRMDTTKAHLAYSYSIDLKKIPLSSVEKDYISNKAILNKISSEHNISLQRYSSSSEKLKIINSYIYKCINDLPIYSAYIVYQALTKGGQNSLFEETYYFNKKYECLGQEYNKFWEDQIL